MAVLVSTWREFAVPQVVRETLKADGAVSIRGYQQGCEDGGHLSVLIAKEPTGWHLSISHRFDVLGPNGYPSPGRYPTWDEIADARYDLLPDEVTMAMLLPPRDQYVNIHPTTFHLHEIESEPTEMLSATPRSRR